MANFPFAYSDDPDAARLARQLADGLGQGDAPGGGLGLLYLTDVLANQFSSVAEHLRRSSGVEHWIGTLGVGVMAGADAALDRAAGAAMILDVSSDMHRLLPRTPIPDRWPDDLMRWAETVRPGLALIHADGTTPALANLVETLAQRSGAYLVGGLTCSRGPQHQLADDIGAGGVSGAMFSPEVAVTVGLSQGCSPLAPPREVTGGEGNIIREIDGRAALDVFKEDIGEILSRDLHRVAGYVHVAFPVSGADTADYLVRNLVAIDRERGWLGVGTEIAPGDRVMFVRRDPASARADLVRMLADVRKRLPGPARGAVYVSCVARGPNMFGDESAEAEIVADALDGTPVVGFYAGGEISLDRLYGYTGVLTVFG